jgi:hypothetical protein
MALDPACIRLVLPRSRTPGEAAARWRRFRNQLSAAALSGDSVNLIDAVDTGNLL